MKAIADNARWKGLLCPQTEIVNTVKEAAPARATDLLQSPSKASYIHWSTRKAMLTSTKGQLMAKPC